MAITHDADSNKVVNGFASSPTETWNHTTASGATLLVLSVMTWQDTPGSGTVGSASYNSVAMTKALQVRTGGMSSEIWYLVSPTSGTHSVSVVISGMIDAFKAGVSTYSGTTTSSVLGTTGSTTANGGNITTSVTTTVDNSLLVDSLSYFGTEAQTKGAGETAIYNDSTGSTSGAASYKITTTAGSYSMSYTTAGAGDDSQVVAEFKPAATTTTAHNLTLLGVGS